MTPEQERAIEDEYRRVDSIKHREVVSRILAANFPQSASKNGSEDESAFSAEQFRAELHELGVDDFADRAFDLVDKFSLLPKSEVSKIQRFLKKGGMTAREIQNWQQAVRARIREQKDSADENADNSEESSKGIITRLAEHIRGTDYFAYNRGERLYYYEEGYYKPNAKKYLQLKCLELLEEWGLKELWSEYRVNQVIILIRIQSPELWEVPPSKYRHWINIESGLIDLENGEHYEHTPDFLSPIQFPIVFKKDAEAKAWDEFYRIVYPEDVYKAGVHWEKACWALLNTNPGQKAILLVGPGSDGKSRDLQACRSLIGHANTSNLSLQTLGNNRFAASGIIGKALNICADLPSTHLQDTSLFKALTGGDVIGGEYKGGDFFEFYSRCKLIFSANQVPSAQDNTEGFLRRWLIIPMDNQTRIIDRKPADELDAELSTLDELAGVLNKIIDVAPKVIKEGITETASMEAANQEFRISVDHFSVWLKGFLAEDAAECVTHTAIMKSYNEFCKTGKIAARDGKEVKSLIQRQFPSAEWGTIPGKDSERCDNGFKGLRLIG